ncbi:30S ribosomal protein S13 [Candidatus Micrarchaeota archaeon]|nr:30S ribosomal protein S13 [Candidatus Micrarchaeota archaeon]MBD3417852.1 30S ribosomal protein S13 [Candidatus Micrarchaeota archaeon]
MAKAKKKDSKKKNAEVSVEASKKPAKKKAPPKEEEGVRGIIRLAGKDVPGQLTLRRALLRVKGIGQTTRLLVAEIIAKELKVSPTVKVGTFTDEQIEKIDSILMNIQAHAVPAYLLNRRKSRESGKDEHNIMNDLVFSQRQDIEHEKKLYTWKGYRHHYGQKVRGQRTKNTGRHGMSLGVIRKTQQPGQAKKDSKK